VDKLSLHPKAYDCLFKHYRALRNIFHDVLGHLELDFLSMALISPDKEICFFSSCPALELNLIEQNLWKLDPMLNQAYENLEKVLIWEEMYADDAYFKLKHYKIEKTGICYGFSKITQFKTYRVVYSFGVFQPDLSLQSKLQQNIETLLAMGKYCLQNIFEVIDREDTLSKQITKKTHLYVVKPQQDIIY
jgi:hypothetical protein